MGIVGSKLFGPDPSSAAINITNENAIKTLLFMKNPHMSVKSRTPYKIMFQVINKETDILATDSSAAFNDKVQGSRNRVGKKPLENNLISLRV